MVVSSSLMAKVEAKSREVKVTGGGQMDHLWNYKKLQERTRTGSGI